MSALLEKHFLETAASMVWIAAVWEVLFSLGESSIAFPDKVSGGLQRRASCSRNAERFLQ